MNTVARIITTTTKKGDLLLTFAIQDDAYPGKVRCVILLRSPVQETVFQDHEQGIAVSIEGDASDSRDLEGNLLREFILDLHARSAVVKTRNRTCHLDLSQTPPSQVAEMQAHLRQMNFDARTTIVGL